MNISPIIPKFIANYEAIAHGMYAVFTADEKALAGVGRFPETKMQCVEKCLREMFAEEFLAHHQLEATHANISQWATYVDDHVVADFQRQLCAAILQVAKDRDRME